MTARMGLLPTLSSDDIFAKYGSRSSYESVKRDFS